MKMNLANGTAIYKFHVKLGEIHEYFVTTVIPTFEKFISKQSLLQEVRLIPGRAVYQK